MKRIVGSHFLAFLCLSDTAHSAEKWFEVKSGSWHPSQRAMATLEPNLREYVLQQAATLHRVVRPWQTYRFQYQGQGSSKNREVEINAFCADFGQKNFSQDWVVVEDGGTCFFRVKYIPATGKFFNLEFNGEA